MSLQTVKCIVSKQVACESNNKIYGLHNKDKNNLSKLVLKTIVLQAIDLNSYTSYLTTTQINQMLSRISNPNIYL